MRRLTKPITVLSVSLLLLAAITVGAQAQSTVNNAKVEAFFQRLDKAINGKNIEEVKACFSPDYMLVFAGPNREQLLQGLSQCFTNQKEVRNSRKIEWSSTVGKFLEVVTNWKLEGRKDDASEWKTVNEATSVDFLTEVGDSYQIRAGAEVKKERFKTPLGRKYENKNLGFSFSVPEGWALIPVVFPSMMEAVEFLAPDGSSSGMFGYLEVPYNLSAKGALDGDDLMAQKLAKDKFQMISSATPKVAGIDAVESITRFTIKGDDRDRYRRRVYFNAGGLLYVLNFDAIPAERWSEFAPGFQEIVNSFTLSEQAKTSAVKEARKQVAAGEIAGRIYSNSKVGCQIAAPEGWKMESTNISEGLLFTINIKPAQGNSLVRFIGAETKGKATLDAIVNQQIEAVKAIGKDVESQPVQDLQVGKQQGKSFVQSFEIAPLGKMKRKTVMFMANNILYMFFCDALPPTMYETLEPRFDEIIQSFTVN